MGYAIIRLRRGTLYEWTTTNPVIKSGEIVVEHPNTGVGTGLCKFKQGDGTTKYADLPYAFDGASANAIYGGDVDSFHLIQLRTGTTAEWKAANTVLLKHEIAYDSTVNSIKIGDGTTLWSNLPYIYSATEVAGVIDCGDEK